MAATVEHLTFPLGEGGQRKAVQECVEHTLRKDQKITKNTKNICLKDKKEKKQINNAGFW